MKRTYQYEKGTFGVQHDLTFEITLPDWIRKAKRNRTARVKRYAKKHSISFEKAENFLNDLQEDKAQEQN